MVCGIGTDGVTVWNAVGPMGPMEHGEFVVLLGRTRLIMLFILLLIIILCCFPIFSHWHTRFWRLADLSAKTLLSIARGFAEERS